MSNEIQLSSLGGGLPMQPGAAAPGGGLGGYYGSAQAGGSAGDESPFRKAHKLLRGRYLLAFVLGLLGAAGGAAAGYLSQKPAFKAEGLIEIRPVIVDPNNEKVMVMFTSYIQSQMGLLLSDNLVRQAMRDARWQKVRPGPVTDASIVKFLENLSVTLPRNSNTMILVAYSEKTPDAEAVAPAAVQSLIDAYKVEYDKTDALNINSRIAALEKQDKDINARIAAKRQLIQRWTSVTDGTDTTQLQYLVGDLVKKQQELSQARESIAAAEQALKVVGARKATAEDWARVDTTMAGLVKLRDDLQLIVGSLIAQFGGTNHPSVLTRQKELEPLNAKIAKYADELEAKYLIRWSLDGMTGAMVPKDIGYLREAEKRMAKELETKSAEVQQLREVALQIQEARDDIKVAGDESKLIAKELGDWRFRKDNTMLARVLAAGSIAKLDKDRRPVFAALGFMAGAGLPIGLLMLFGAFDTRYRYSDETAAVAGLGGAGPGGLTLLGILPNLPDRLSDPEQAAIAAHCVHQIRTMLQINTGLEDRRVFAVTSASPGDGKTSLTLALGLSYAACGTRTLLIDCDLIGNGLSHRMNVNAPEGVLEAIANRSMLPYVRQTDVNDVSILPVGSASGLHASTLSPQALRRLIEEAEQHFEVVLIDTGPVLGSIEASLVCAAADAVILAVSRGQQRPMVERSLGHLSAIGAKLAGVVFNRAQAQDFERSISGASIRSVGVPGLPKGARPGGPRLGPVARAVQNQGAGANGNGNGHDDGPEHGPAAE